MTGIEGAGVPGSGFNTRGQVFSVSQGRNRTVLIGDSQLAFNYLSVGVPTSAGSLVVSNGVATVATSAVHNIQPGQYFHIFNQGDPTWAQDPFNNTNPKCLSAPTTTSLTFATNAANGDYSAGYAANAWQLTSLNTTYDFGLFYWLNALLRGQWRVMGQYAVGGRTTADVILQLPKILAGPAFDEAIVQIGINDIVTAAANTTAAQAGAVTAFQNLTGVGLGNPAKGILPQLLAYGCRVVVIAAGAMPSTYAGTQYRNIASANLRWKLKEWCYRYPQQIRFVDAYADMVLGTSTAGDVVASYTQSADLHLTSVGAINCAKFEVANFANWFPSIDLQNVSVLEDPTTYSQPGALFPNIIPHGGMDGTTGTLGAGGVTGSIATGWSGQGSTGTVVGTGNTARTATGSANNSANWGFCQDITFSGTAPSWTIQSPNFVANLVAGNTYQFGFTVRAIGTQTGLANISGNVVFGGGVSPGNTPFGANNATYDNGYPLVDGDTFEFVSPPYVYGSGYSPTVAALNIAMSYTGAATGHLQISNVWARQIDNPVGP